MPWKNPPGEFLVWKALRQRCLNPKSKDYPYYGARGITVTKRWDKYSNFIADMGPRPSPRHQLDRENNSKGYSKSNCRWVLRKTNMRNTRQNVRVRYKGMTVTLIEAAERTGINYSTLAKRKARGLTERTGLFSKTNLWTGEVF